MKNIFKCFGSKNRYEVIVLPKYQFPKKSRVFSVPEIDSEYKSGQPLLSIYNDDIGIIDIKSSVDGKVVDLYVKLNDLVIDGDKLCTMEISKN